DEVLESLRVGGDVVDGLDLGGVAGEIEAGPTGPARPGHRAAAGRHARLRGHEAGDRPRNVDDQRTRRGKCPDSTNGQGLEALLGKERGSRAVVDRVVWSGLDHSPLLVGGE